MNRITLSLVYLVFVSLFFSNSTFTQNYRLIDLNSSTIETPSLEYYVLDVFDSRKLQSSIGITKSGDKKEIIMLNFTGSFHDELITFFSSTYPTEEGKAPMILNVKKLWLTEFEEEGSTYSRCEIDIEFLTPKNQKFYECNKKNEVALNDNPNVHKDNIITSIDNCLQDLQDTEIKKTYYAVLSNSDSAITPTEQTRQDDVYVAGSETKVLSTAYNARIAVQGGYTYRTGRLPSGIDEATEDHLKSLKNGYNFGADFNYFWNEKHSLGASASFSQAKSTLADVSAFDDQGNLIATGDLAENIKLLYIGPSYFHRSGKSNDKIYILFGLTMGYYTYNEEVSWIGESINITGGTFGLGFSFGADFLTSDNFAIGLQFSILAGSLKEMTVDGIDIELDEYESLTRVDLTVGIRFLP